MYNKGDWLPQLSPAPHGCACCWLYLGTVIWWDSFPHHLYVRVNVTFCPFSWWWFEQYLHGLIPTKF